MRPGHASSPTIRGPYEISIARQERPSIPRVCGRLTPDWSDRLQGMRIATVEAQGYGLVSELTGELADQAALMGVLMHLYECGIALISVRHERFAKRNS